MNKSPSTIIVGAGFAGLATAIELLSHDPTQHISILEAGAQLGGRARSTPMHSPDGTSTIVDNGQHLMLGAYRQMLAVLSQIGVREEDVFLRLPLRLWVRDLNGSELDLNASVRLPAPWHLLLAFVRAKGISWLDKMRGISSIDRLMRAQLDANSDISVSDLLARYRVPMVIRQKLHQRLCIAALNTAPEQASARVFVKVLHTAFKNARENSDLLIPITDLGALYAEPAMHYLQDKGADIHSQSRVQQLLFEHGQLTGVRLGDDSCLYADNVVLATDYRDAHKLIQPLTGAIPALEPLAHTLAGFRDEPIVTIYYQFGAEVALPVPMLGMLGGLGEWVFDRRIVGQLGLLAVVICASGRHNQLKRAELGQVVLAELRQLLLPILGDLPAPKDILVLKERRATFACTIGIDAKRPHNQTALANLWLAGDYTDTSYPATLEGAVLSGRKCAKAMTAQLG